MHVHGHAGLMSGRKPRMHGDVGQTSVQNGIGMPKPLGMYDVAHARP